MRATTACAAAAMLLLLPACGTGEDTATALTTDSHTMSDGTVMEGETHDHDDGHDHDEGDSGPEAPSAAAEMVCAGQVVEDVERIMGLTGGADPEPVWDDPILTCTFDLEVGPLVLSVHDADERAAGVAYFEGLRTGARGAAPIEGVASLGLPAFRTAAGTVAFVRDGKTLEVDATGLRGRAFGPQADQSRADVAYAIANSVLACWTQHS